MKDNYDITQSQPRPQGSKNTIRAVLLSVLGAAISPLFTVIGSGLMGAGIALFSKEKKPLWGIASIFVVAIIVSLVNVSQGIKIALVAIVAYFIIKLMSQPFNWFKTTALMLITAVALLAADFGSAWLVGQNYLELLQSQLVQIAAPLEGELANAGSSGVVNQAIEWITRLLPALYVTQAFSIVLPVFIGALFAQRGRRRLSYHQFIKLDAPIVFVAVLIVGVLLLAFSGFANNAIAAGMIAAGINIILIVRFAFMIQGFAVVIWWLMRRPRPLIMWLLVFFVGVHLEIFVMGISLIGLIDMWANFRKLQRD